MTNESFSYTPQELIDLLNRLLEHIPPEMLYDTPDPIPDYRESGADIVILPDSFTAVIDEDGQGRASRVRLRWRLGGGDKKAAFLSGILVSGLFTLLAGMGEDTQLIERVLSNTLADKPLFFSMNGTTVFHSFAGGSHSLDFFKERADQPC